MNGVRHLVRRPRGPQVRHRRGRSALHRNAAAGSGPTCSKGGAQALLPGAFPALAGNRAVTLADPTNLVRVVLQGGYLPATAGNPRPHGMPPFQQVLSDEDIAAVTTFVRNQWGNRAAGVGTIEVYRARERRGL